MLWAIDLTLSVRFLTDGTFLPCSRYLQVALCLQAKICGYNADEQSEFECVILHQPKANFQKNVLPPIRHRDFTHYGVYGRWFWGQGG